MIVAGHQPAFLPSTRYFYKMAKSDILDLRQNAQFIDRGYFHRVKFRDSWFTLPLSPKPGYYDPISTVRVDLPRAKEMFRNTMQGRYGGSRYYKTRGKELIDKFDSLGSEMLWQIDLDLILYIRDLLGIETPVSIGVDTIGGKGEGVLSNLRCYPGADAYLSGVGAKKYMGDTSVFDEAGIKVIWSRHAPVTDDSIVSILMDHSDPMDFVLREDG
jgi:WbqC-like protein family